MISNSRSVAKVFSQIDHKFDLMYNKRSFMHWHICLWGSEGRWIQWTSWRPSCLEKDYEEVGAKADDEEEGEDNEEYQAMKQ